MMLIIRRFFLSVLVVLIGFFCFSNISASSQFDSKGLVLTPAILEQVADRGNVYSLSIQIKNDTNDKTYDLTILTKTFKASNQEGVPELRDFEQGDSYKDWISYPESSFLLAPNQTKDVQIILNIPANANPGGYYYAIIFSNKNKADNTINTVLINERISSLLFLNVNGKVQRSVQFQSVKTSSDFKTEKTLYDPFFDPIELSYKISVSGNSYLKPLGNVVFYQNSDKPEDIIEINPDKKIILPDSARTFKIVSKPNNQVDWISESPDVLDQIDTNQVIDLNHPLFGSQTIEMKVTYVNSDGDLDVVTTKKDIYFFPWKSGLLILSVIAIFIAIFIFWRKTKRVKKI